MQDRCNLLCNHVHLFSSIVHSQCDPNRPIISSASSVFIRIAEADNSFSPKDSDSGRCPVNANLIV